MVGTSAAGRPFPGWEDVAEDIIPKTDDTYDLGSSTKKWAYLYAVIAILTSLTIGGVINMSVSGGVLIINDSTQIQGDLTVDEDLLVTGNFEVLGNTTTLNVTEVNINGSAFPQLDNLFDLGSNALRWRNLFVGSNILLNGSMTADDNITASYFLGDGSKLTGIQHGDLIFFMHNETSTDFPSSRVLKYMFNDTGESTIAATVTENGFEIINFTTDDGIPGLSIIPDGVGHVHFHAKKADGTKDAQIYYQFYKIDTNNVSTLIATSESSDVLTGSSVSYNIHCTHVETLLETTDRLRVLLLADESGAGTDAEIEIYIEGNSGSRIEVPGPVASTANFVPYTGAIKGLNLGSHNFTTTGYFAGNGSQLTGVLTSYTETDPLWEGNSTLVPYLASANVFTAGQNLTGQNITAIDCIIFDSGGKICSGA